MNKFSWKEFFEDIIETYDSVIADVESEGVAATQHEDYKAATKSIEMMAILMMKRESIEMQLQSIVSKQKCEACKGEFLESELTSTNYGQLCEADYLDYLDEQIID